MKLSKQSCFKIITFDLAGLMLLTACSPSDSPRQSAAFTLETGVTVTQQKSCDSVTEEPSLSILQKTGGTYEVKVREILDCDAQIQPYVTEPLSNKATLVLVLNRREKGGFSSSCECGRYLAVEIAGRLAGGDTLYVLNGYRVTGHVTVPMK